MRYQVQGRSAIDGRNLIMGEGETKKEAWQDAIGPKPWTPPLKRWAEKFWIVDTATTDYLETQTTNKEVLA